jgi:hypothetical protein
LRLNFIIGYWGYIQDREGRVSWETCLTVCIAVRRAEIVGKMIQKHRERERERERKRMI